MGEGLNTTGRKGCFDLRLQDEEDMTNPQAKYKNLIQDTTDTDSCSIREFGVVCVPPKAKK